MSEEVALEQADIQEEAPEPELTPDEVAAKSAYLEARRARIIRIRDRYQGIQDNVKAVCERCGRDPKEVKIIAVSKTVQAPEVKEAIMAGLTDFAENRPDIIKQKAAIFPEVNWHYIGNIQTKHVRAIVPASDFIHSVADTDIISIIHTRTMLEHTNKKLLLEINISGEESKLGLAPRNVDGALRSIANFSNLECIGFMTMAPQGDPEAARAAFRGLRELRDKMAKKYENKSNIHLDELSMGMSEDYEIAIEEGATMIRIGRAIFDDKFVK